MSTVAPIESASWGGVVSDVENSALGIFIHHLSNFRQKIDRVLSAGLVARVQAARLGLTGVLLGLASKQTFHFMMRVRKDSPVSRIGSSKNFPIIARQACGLGFNRPDHAPIRQQIVPIRPGAAKIC
jgi:hypothetical protein